jgi:hypothetical protein
MLRRFCTVGVIRTWDPAARELTILEQRYVLAPEVAIAGVGRDARVQVSGYQADRRSPRLIIRLVVRKRTP